MGPLSGDRDDGTARSAFPGSSARTRGPDRERRLASDGRLEPAQGERHALKEIRPEIGPTSQTEELRNSQAEPDSPPALPLPELEVPELE